MFEIGDKFLMWGMQGCARKQVLVTVGWVTYAAETPRAESMYPL